MASVPRAIRVAHQSPGRLRLRLPWLRHDADGATALADDLAELPGMIEVAVRPSTGSVLCTFEADALDAARIIAAVRRCTGVTRVLDAQEELTAPTTVEPVAAGSSVARALVDAVRGVNQDVLRESGGRMDLATLASLGFFAAGAMEIAASRRLPAPPWFNLAWWAVRTLTEFESAPPPTPPSPLRPARRNGRLRAVPRSRRAAT
jgi:hypothetical protein